MRRKQLYAIILAGALATSSAPAAVFAAEGDVAAMAETSEEAPAEGDDAAADSAAEDTPAQDNTDAADTPADTPAQDNTAAATEAPAQDTTADATEAPAEQTQDQTTEETPAAEVTETPADGDNTTTEETLAEGESETPTGISITFKATEEGQEDKVRYFTSLQAAINYAPAYDKDTAPDATVIEVSDMIALDSTVKVENKKICITAANAVTITRKDTTFAADMFAVSGDNGELQFDVREDATDASLTVSGKLGDGNGDSATGSIVSVGTGASLGIDAGVTLQENNTTADGGAITNNGGSVVLAGGTITGNSGTKGAVYTNTDLYVQGTVVVKDNTPASVYLAGTSTIVVTDALTNSNINFTHEKAADKLTVVKAGTNADKVQLSAANFKTAITQIKYSTNDYTLEAASDGLSATLKKKASEPDNPTTPELKLTYVTGSIEWKDYSTLNVAYTNNVAYKWGYYFVDPGTSNAQIIALNDGSKLPYSVETVDKKYTMKISSVPSDKKWLVICAKADGGNPKYKIFKLNTLYANSSDKEDKKTFWSKRPSDPNKKNDTREARTYKVAGTVTGLESPLKFFPAKRYDFTVVGAGQNDTDPITGDERWIPIYWSTSSKPTKQKQKNTSWKIGSNSGIKDEATYTMYIFFRKQVYTEGTGWTDTDVVESISTPFYSAGYTDEELKEYLQEAKDNGTVIPGYENYTGGDSTDAELTATAAASEKDAGSKSKSAVSTADESPIGTMSALAALSLLAGGYIVVRKRKKEEL